MAARQQIQISGPVLRWARGLRGYSLQKAADAIGVPPSELAALETGQNPISLGRLDLVAQAYKQTRSALLRASPPAAAPPPQDFRSVGSARLTASEDVLLVVREARRIQRALADMLEVDPGLFPRADVTTCTLDDDVEQAAKRERKALGLDPDLPSHASAAQVYQACRSLLERRGILVFQKKWPRSEGLGVSLLDADRPPVIIVNTDRQNYQARSFTLFHEYAHLLLRRPGVSDQQVRSGPHLPVEQWCNRVAAAMLMPRDVLLSVVASRHADLKPWQWDLSHVGSIASRFRVSYMAAGIRLKQCGVTDAIDRMAHLIQARDIEPHAQPPGPARPFRRSPGRARFYEVGPEVADAFLKALQAEVIDTRDASAILNLNHKSLDTFAELAAQSQRAHALPA